MDWERFAVLGGTFDPIHIGHLIIAQVVLEKFKLDGCLFIPSGIPSQKVETMFNSQERLTMVKLATERDERFKVSDIEVKSKEVSYTYRTFEEILKRYGSKYIYFIVGSDILYEYKTWYRYNELLDLVYLIVVPRRETFILYQKFSRAIDKGRWRYDKDEGILYLIENKGKIFCVRTPIIEISSTMIRERIRRGLSIRYLVPEIVENYLSSRGAEQ
ncbi:MAG: nicotinate-nucleotide adenylyltransferase [bacterium]